MKRRKVIRIASRILVVMCLISLISLGCADRWILGQNHETIVPSGVRSAVVSVDGRRVECWVARSPGGRVREPEGFVLFFVGKAERTDRWTLPVAQAWGERAVEVLGDELSGLGRVGWACSDVSGCAQRAGGL